MFKRHSGIFLGGPIVINGLLAIIIIYMMLAGNYNIIAPHAMASEVFSVYNISVNESARTEVKAKENALLFAKKKAFSTLIRRLVPLKYLSPLAPDAPIETENTLSIEEKNIFDIDDARLTDLVEKFSISDEKFGNNRYKATIQIDFSPPAIREILKEYRLPHAEIYSLPLVIIPLMQQDKNTHILWDDGNILLNNLQHLSLTDSLLPKKIPYADIEDIALISLDDVAKWNIAALSKFMKRYQAYGLIILGAGSQNTGGDKKLILAGRMIYAQKVNEIGPLTYNIPNDNPADIQMAIKDILAKFDEEWKQDNLITSDEGETFLTANVTSGNLANWNGIREKINTTSIVKDIEILHFSKNKIVIKIEYQGMIEQLKTALFNQGLSLNFNERNNEWHIKAY